MKMRKHRIRKEKRKKSKKTEKIRKGGKRGRQEMGVSGSVGCQLGFYPAYLTIIELS